MAKKVFIFGLIFAATLLLYRQVFGVYFVGDDFFHFKVSNNLFGFHPIAQGGYAFYRPLFREVTYNISLRFWGLNQIPLRILSFLMHFVNIILVYVLIKRLFKSEKMGILTAALFGVSVANAGALYYLAGGLQAQGAALFILSTLILFPKHKNFTFISFLLALTSHEIAAVTPVLLLGLMFVNKNFRFRYLLPYIFIILVYLFIDFKIVGFSQKEIQYKPVLDPKKSLNSLFWYSLWSLGIPETLIDFVNPGFSLNPNLMKYWGDSYKFIFPSFFVSASTLFLLAILKIKEILKQRKFLFVGLWFIAGLAPVLFLPLHKSTYYLALSLPAFFGIVAFLLFNKNWLINILSVIFLISFGILTIYSIRVMDATYWAAERGRLSEKLLKGIKAMYLTLPPSSIIYIKDDPNYPFIAKDWGGTSKQADLILSGADAIDLFYNDNSIKVYYQYKDKISQGTIYPFVAKIQ